MSEEINQEEKVEKMIDDLVKRAKIASEEYLKLDQKTVDNITKAMSMAGLEHHMELAKMAVEERESVNFGSLRIGTLSSAVIFPSPLLSRTLTIPGSIAPP